MKARGYVLASTLSILLLISTIALAVSFMGRLEHKAAERRSEKRQAELAARSGLAFAESKLDNLEGAYFSLVLLDHTETWDSADLPALPFSFIVRLEDETGKLDLNLATVEMLERLGFTSQQAQAIVSWREERPFAAVWELEEALGTGALQETGDLASFLTLWSRSPNLNPEGRPKLQLGNFTAQELVAASGGEVSSSVAERLERAQITQLSQLAEVVENKEELAEVVDWIADAEGADRGKININTAPVEVLRTIPGFTDELVEIIYQRRHSAPFTRLAELVRLDAFSLSFWAECAAWVTVGSSAFSLEAEGSYRQGIKRIFAVYSEGRYLYWQED